MFISFNFASTVNPLVTDPLYLVCTYGKNFDFKKEEIIEKISYDLRAYESADDRSCS